MVENYLKAIGQLGDRSSDLVVNKIFFQNGNLGNVVDFYFYVANTLNAFSRCNVTKNKIDLFGAGPMRHLHK